ncbi:TetR/AcrR family transcriptional regulator [Kribbella sp. NPDC056345]|uniref:TetR/AcrR family transcriptional regulator n=1 Tax=Kribbella sp. NPDC056345 TaxID=3345789 RepID=UPI0035DBFCCB
MVEARRASGQHHGDLRRALEDAALELIRTSGLAGFTLANASRKAGVSVAAPFKHYANKEALLAQLAMRSYDEQARRFAVALAGEISPLEQLVAFARAYVQFAIEEPALFELVFAAGIDKAAFPELDRAGARLSELLIAPASRLRSDRQQALALVHAVAASSHGYAVFLREGVFGNGTIADDIAIAGAESTARALALVDLGSS